MAERGKAPAHPVDETAPVGTLRRKPQTEYEAYLRRCGHPGWLSATSDDTEPSEESSHTSPVRSRTRSNSPRVAAPTISPIPPIRNGGTRVVTRPRMSVRPGSSVSFRMPPPPPPHTRIPTPAPVRLAPPTHLSHDEYWMPPRHNMPGGPSVLARDQHSQSSRWASDFGPSDPALSEILRTIERHELTLQHATWTSQSAQYQAMLASEGVQRLEQEQKKKSSGWMGWLKRKWM